MTAPATLAGEPLGLFSPGRNLSQYVSVPAGLVFSMALANLRMGTPWKPDEGLPLILQYARNSRFVKRFSLRENRPSW